MAKMFCAVCATEAAPKACSCPPGGTFAAHIRANELLRVVATAKVNNPNLTAEERDYWWTRLGSAECALFGLRQDVAGYTAMFLSNGHVALRAKLDRFPQ